MTPPIAAENTSHLLISTTSKGILDHNSLLESYREFNDAIVEAGIQKLVVLISDDGHSSRFDELFCSFSKMSRYVYLFSGSPDTTGVSHLLDQVKQFLI